MVVFRRVCGYSYTSVNGTLDKLSRTLGSTGHLTVTTDVLQVHLTVATDVLQVHLTVATDVLQVHLTVTTDVLHVHLTVTRDGIKST